ncbi:hypothetical protein [Methanosarcina horonobensis]|uniref:hypothetical protein n=1 Tax=Methanosarcina horonobensis TaxID=418008 RepID=UPI000A4C443E|nr:hypothetical protein [Methanosarcina horonobensis]
MITINEAFRTFLSEQEASLKPDAFLDCEDVILLYEEFLELNAETTCQKKIGLFVPPVPNVKTRTTLMFVIPTNLALQESRISLMTMWLR